MKLLLSLLFVFCCQQLHAVDKDLGHRKISDGDVLNFLNSIIEAFETHGSIEYCIYLTQRFAGLRDDVFDERIVNYHLAKKYGEACIEQGVNHTPAGWAVNIWLAHVYTHYDHEQAKAYLDAAISLDKNGQIKQLDLIKRYELESITQ